MTATLTELFPCQFCDKVFKRPYQLEKHNLVCTELTCQFCLKTFKTETGLTNHMCEKKRRFLSKDDRDVRMGFMAFRHHWEKVRAGNPLQKMNYEKFAESTMYKSYVEFGRYLIRLNAINPLGFVDYLLKKNIQFRNWMDGEVYQKYVRELNKIETPVEALERNILLMQQWSIETGEEWYDFFRKISGPQAVLWIKSGRISPWLLFTASSASDMLSRLNDNEQAEIDTIVDINFWTNKIKRHEDAMNCIQEELTQAGL